MQRTFRGLILSAAAACLVMPAIAAPGAQAAEKPQEWELVNPAGIIEKASVDPAKRIASLDGKTISGTAAESERIAKAVASVKPDLVIASQCD